MAARLIAGLAGLIFGVGLAVAGMLDPAKVSAFLDFFGGHWDATLAFVMGGAILVHAPLRRLVSRRGAPKFDTRFHEPVQSQVDHRLLMGSAVFGLGWGLGGYCPGPALASAAGSSLSAVVFVAAMVVGMLAFRYFERHRPPADDEA
jgi:uncharacterized membrane protein YedE/YeeE